MATVKIYTNGNQVVFEDSSGVKYPYNSSYVEARYTSEGVFFLHQLEPAANSFPFGYAQTERRYIFDFADVLDEAGAGVGDKDAIITYLSDKLGFNIAGAAASITGWGYYADSLATTASQVFTTTPSKLLIDGLASNTDEDWLPLAIRGVSSLWEDDEIKAISLGDTYITRIDLTITNKTAGASRLDIVLDIGGDTTPTIIIVNESANITKNEPFGISIPIPLFARSVFLANGGQIFISSDQGSVTVTNRGIMVARNSKGVPS